MFSTLFEKTWKGRFQNFCLWVLEDNAPAIHFYKKFGFVCNGEKSEEDYKDTQIVDIKMIKKMKIYPTQGFE